MTRTAATPFEVPPCVPLLQGRCRRAWQVLALVLLAALVAGASFGWRGWRQARDRAAGLDLYTQGRFAEAELLLRQAAAANPADVAVVQALALGYQAAGNDAEAAAYLDRWCALEPAGAEPHTRRMELRVKQLRIDEAIADGERVLAVAADDGEIQQRLVALQIVKGRYAEAEQVARRFVQRQPGSQRLRYLLAEACHLQGKDAEAAAVLEPLILSQPDYPDALILRAILYSDADQPEQAIPLLRRVLARDPTDFRARYHLSQALGRTGQTAEAARETAELLRQNDEGRLLIDRGVQPDNLDLQIRAAEVLLRRGQVDEGRRLLQTVLARSPGHPAVLRLLTALPGRSANGPYPWRGGGPPGRMP